MSIVNKTKTDLSSFNYRKVEKSRSQPSNTSNLPTPPTRVTEVTTTNVSVDFSKLAGMSRGSNDVKQPSQNYLNMHRFNDGFGNVGLQVIKTAEDIKRWTKWNTTDGKGLLFNVKQAVLQRFNAQKNTRIYNPLGLFGSVVPFVHLPRHTKGTFIDLVDPPKYNKESEVMDNVDVTPESSGLGKSIGKLFKGLAGPDKAEDYGLGTGKIKAPGGNLYSVETSNQLQVPYHGRLNDPAASSLPKDFIKFRIRDLVNGKWLVFPAFLGTITDTVTPTWTPEKYIGRADSVHIYSGADRTVSFDFKVAAFTKQEIPIIQEKMNYLVGLAYPSYKKLFDGDTEQRPVAPYISLTIGDLFMNTPGYFSSITITMEESATWELDDGFQIPMYFTVGCEFTYIGKYLPQTLGKHYEVPWLKDLGTSQRVIKTKDGKDTNGSIGRNAGTFGADEFRPDVDGKEKFKTEIYDKASKIHLGII
jgi:hypothetical protein